jgi:hypothetical protein
LKKVFFNFLLIFFLGGEEYGVAYDTVVTNILNMGPGKHNLHFLVGVELLPHTIMNISNKTIHIGVFIFIFIIYYIFIIIILFILYNSYIFILSSLPVINNVAITLISISYLSFPPTIPNVKCIAWNFDESNVIGIDDMNEDLNQLRFENGDIIPNVKSYFI